MESRLSDQERTKSSLRSLINTYELAFQACEAAELGVQNVLDRTFQDFPEERDFSNALKVAHQVAVIAYAEASRSAHAIVIFGDGGHGRNQAYNKAMRVADSMSAYHLAVVENGGRLVGAKVAQFQAAMMELIKERL